MAKSTSHLRTRSTYHVGNLAPQLLTAARQMLSEVGPTKLSMRAISERVGVSCTAAYHHFANRADLLAHLGAHGFLELATILARRTPNAGGREQLRQGTQDYFAFARANPELYQLMFGPELAHVQAPAFLQARASAFAELKNLIADIYQLPAETPAVRSASLSSWAYIHGLASLVGHAVIQLPSGTTDEILVDRTLQGFAGLFQALESMQTPS